MFVVTMFRKIQIVLVASSLRGINFICNARVANCHDG